MRKFALFLVALFISFSAFAQDPAVISIGGPSSVNLGDVGQWTTTYTADPGHNISIQWAFDNQSAKGAQPAAATRAAGGPFGSSTCSHKFTSPGQYQVTAMVSWDSLMTLSISTTVDVIAPTVTPTVIVDSPFGGENVLVNADGSFSISYSWHANYTVEWPWAYLVNTQDPTVSAVASDYFEYPAASGCGVMTQDSLLTPGTKLPPGTYWIKIIDQGPNSPMQNPYTGWSQAFTVMNTPTLNQPTLNVAATTPSQYVAGGVPNATRLSYDFSVNGNGPVTITEMDFAVTGGIVSIGIGGSVTAGAANNAVKLSGLNTVVSPSSVGNLNLMVTYAPVEANGIPSGTPAQVVLVGVKYLSGGVVQTLSCSVSAPPVTLVGSVPTVSLFQASPAMGTSGVENRIGTATVSAGPKGAVKVDVVTFGIGSVGTSVAGMRIICNGVPIQGSSCGFAGNATISCNLGSGLTIPSGQAVTFDLYATCTGAGNLATWLRPLSFIWDDVAGGGVGLNGQLIPGWPTNSYNLSIGATVPASGPDVTVRSLTAGAKVDRHDVGNTVYIKIRGSDRKHKPDVVVEVNSTTTIIEKF